MDQTTLFYRFGVALFIGILIGLQREYAYDAEGRSDRTTFAGVRTFALMALAGCAAAFMGDILGSVLVFAAVLVLMGGLIAVSYVHTGALGEVGITTEVAAILTILAGGLAYWGELAVAVALAVTVVALLATKFELHRFAEKLTREDVLATLKFAMITAIVLPVLPNRSFGPPPFDVLNPHKIWLMVVLISGISFLGYILIKLVGPHRGIGLTGIMGGLASSTAVTLSMSARSRTNDNLSQSFAMAIVLAWTIMFVRVLVEVAVVHPALLAQLWLPLAGGGAVALLAAGAVLLQQGRNNDAEELAVSNPFELGPAIGFGLIYAVILLITRAAQMYVGDSGIYLSSLVSGLADVDAITLSVAELTRNGGMDVGVGATAIVLAVISNTVVKGVLAVTGGSAALRKVMIPVTLLILAVALALALLT